ncbi:unnamed protein product [Protopolystoma xenopodis]|uniref:Uncharacterized protein n=1 Tax=Protopolystoma xenopodis TaxID=117903 RepID=A0A3S5A8R7_9PLAT|nr:unnamed protein product [Protopolystoma xenopodis]
MAAWRRWSPESDPVNASERIHLRMLACYTSALNALRKPVEGGVQVNFSSHGFVIHRPEEINEHELFALSYFYELAAELNLIDSRNGGLLEVGDYLRAASIGG